jgi:TPR repeat protein
MTEMEKNFRDLEELYKLGMLDAEGYAFQKKQLEEMAREAEQAAPATSPIQQETVQPQELTMDAESLFKQAKAIDDESADAYDYDDEKGGELLRKAMGLYEQAANMGHIEAMNTLGFNFANMSIYMDNEKALYWFTKAAEHGHKEAQQWVDTHNKKQNKAVKTTAKKTAQQTDAETLIKKGNDAENLKNYADAFKCYSKAAELGDKYGQYKSGFCYEYGRGVTQDYAQAAYWYTKANEQGVSGVQKILDDLKKEGKI